MSLRPEQILKLAEAVRGVPDSHPLWTWLYDEAERQGMQAAAIWQRPRMGKYPGVTERRVNSKVIFLTFPPDGPAT